MASELVSHSINEFNPYRVPFTHDSEIVEWRIETRLCVGVKALAYV